MIEPANPPVGGISFVTALQIAFVCLKLAHVIQWPWPLVFLPWIISGSFIAMILVVVVVIALADR